MRLPLHVRLPRRLRHPSNRVALTKGALVGPFLPLRPWRWLVPHRPLTLGPPAHGLICLAGPCRLARRTRVVDVLLSCCHVWPIRRHLSMRITSLGFAQPREEVLVLDGTLFRHARGGIPCLIRRGGEALSRKPARSHASKRLVLRVAASTRERERNLLAKKLFSEVVVSGKSHSSVNPTVGARFPSVLSDPEKPRSTTPCLHDESKHAH